jgi:predicted dehydrogenase
MSLPRLGFLGVGWIGRHRMQALVESGFVEVAAICDPVEANALEAARSAPDARRAGSLEELLDLGLDGIVIATPSALHAEQSIRALDRGMAVFCQKPLGRTAGEAETVVDAARRADRLLGLDLSYRHTAVMEAIRLLVRSGELGRIHAVDLVFHNAYGPDRPWFFDPRLSGGGCVMDLGVHLVDLALWTLDFPAVEAVESHLFGKGRRLSGRSDVEDFAVATLTLADGAVVRLACSWNLHAGRDAVISAAFHGPEGGAAFENVNGSFFDFTAERHRGTARTRLVDPPDAWGGRAAVAWARQLREGARFDPAAERFIDVARVLDRIYS